MPDVISKPQIAEDGRADWVNFHDISDLLHTAPAAGHHWLTEYWAKQTSGWTSLFSDSHIDASPPQFHFY